jgi:hypothetical protein
MQALKTVLAFENQLKYNLFQTRVKMCAERYGAVIGGKKSWQNSILTEASRT